MNIYVGNLPHATTEETVRRIFEAFGTVANVRIIKDRMTGRSRGFAFVEMSADDEAKNAIESLNGTDVEGRQVVVSEARPPAPRPAGGRGGFGSDRGDRGDRGPRGGGSRGGFGGGGGGNYRSRY